REAVSDEKRPAVMAAVLPLARDQQLQHRAVEIILKWAQKENISQLRELVEQRLSVVAGLDGVAAGDTLALIKHLYSLGESESPAYAMRMLQSRSEHDRA